MAQVCTPLPKSKRVLWAKKSERYIHYRSKVWGHLEMSLLLKEKYIKLIRNTVQTLLMLLKTIVAGNG
jgi:hypothetical protein